MRYYEDIEVGEVHTFSSYEVTESEIVEFATRYDPQAMHLDPDTVEGGPIASGWHTCAMCMRLLVDGYLADVATVASPGVESLKWPNPVRPGDSLSVRLEVVETRPSTSRDDRGVVQTTIEGTNNHGETILSMTAVVLISRRP